MKYHSFPEDFFADLVAQNTNLWHLKGLEFDAHEAAFRPFDLNLLLFATFFRPYSFRGIPSFAHKAGIA